MPTPLFACQNITFSHSKEAPVLAGVTFALHPDESIGITGKNGEGKSTLLHIGAGLLQPDSGEVFHAGVACATEKDFVLARRKLGYLLQRAEDQLFCSTVLEDVAFGPYNLGYTEQEAEQKARQTLADLSLEHLASRNGQRLSGGEQKLAALACILSMDVTMLFLDEPTSNLDEHSQERLLHVLRLYNLPSIIVSHDMPFLQTTCSQILRLHNGILHQPA